MREVWLPLGDVRLFAVEDGHGPALVMLHGGLASHQAVLPLLMPLSVRHRVIAPDLRGSGRSWSSEPLTFDRLADDVARLLDHLSIDQGIIGGVSSGTGVAIRFALRHPSRVRGLVIMKPVYAGADVGYTSGQKAAFAAMDLIASRAPAEGIEVLRPLYAQLPEGFRERAWEIAAEFDPGSVAATSRFIASGAQPFASSADLRSIRVPTLLVRGDDPQHPAEVSDLYAASIAGCSALAATTEDLVAAIGSFCERVARGAA